MVGGGTPSTDDPELWDGDVQWFTPTEVGNSKYVATSARTISKRGLEKCSAKLLPKGTLLLTSRATVGDISIAATDCCTNQGFQSLVVKDGVDNEFVYYAQPLIKRYCLKHAAGSTFIEISGKNLAKMLLLVPSVSEQQKISSFASSVDSIIALCRRKLDLLTRAKKALIQQIFSRKLRFKDDDGSDFPEWEEKKLGDVLEIYHGRDYKQLDPGNIPVMGTGGVITYVDKALCDWDCVCIGRKGTINKPIYMTVPFWSVDTLFFTKAKKNNDPLWQFYLFQTINWDRYNEATGVPSLTSTTIESIRISVPSLPEQKKIAACLGSADALIDQARVELEQWREVKKSLLQQLFV